MVLRSVAVVLAVSLNSAAIARAQLEAAGPAFDVATTLERYQAASGVARAADGRSVVVWESEGQDGSGAAILARRFAANGAALGDEFQVNVAPTGNQFEPAVAFSAGGGFLVAWGNPSAAPYESDVYARAYGPTGVPFGDPFRVHTYSIDGQYLVALEADDTGYFVAWTGSGGPTSSGLFARRFDAAGAPIAAPFAIEPESASWYYPDVALLGDGDFVVGYGTYLSGYQSAIMVQRFDEAALPLGPAVQADASAPDQSPEQLELAADAGGEFVVAWTSYQYPSGAESIRARRFDSAGQTLGAEFVVGLSGDTYYSYLAPAVGRSASGSFVIAWQGPEFEGARARAYLDDGTPAGPEWGIHSPEDYGWDPAVAVDASGRPLFAWSAWRTNTEVDILARHYFAPGLLFADGFASGDTSAWDDVQPLALADRAPALVDRRTPSLDRIPPCLRRVREPARQTPQRFVRRSPIPRCGPGD